MAKTIKFFTVSEDEGRKINIKRLDPTHTVESRFAVAQISDNTTSIHVGWERVDADTFIMHAEFCELVLGDARNDRLEIILTGEINDNKAQIAFVRWCEAWIKESTYPEGDNVVDVDIKHSIYKASPLATINFYENKPSS